MVIISEMGGKISEMPEVFKKAITSSYIGAIPNSFLLRSESSLKKMSLCPKKKKFSYLLFTF